MQDVHLTGSCLCGAVRYEINGAVERFYHCHCQRCRRTTGTGHATNLLVRPESSLTWTQGEELLRRYRVPEAERFYNCFCSQCGSPMPRLVPQLEGVVIPAGTLNEEPPVKPQARIFQNSRTAWSCSGDNLPTWPEYQPTS
ncbi:MAG: GFA family protein [Thiogranum sp.]